MAFDLYDAYLKQMYKVTTVGDYQFEVTYTVPFTPISIKAPGGTNKKWRVIQVERAEYTKKICETYRLRDYWPMVIGR